MVLQKGPGVLVGISTDKAYPKQSITFYDDKDYLIEIDLDPAMPPVRTKFGEEPGLDINLFFRHSLVAKYPPNAKVVIHRTPNS